MSNIQAAFLARQFMVERLTGEPVDTSPSTSFNTLITETAPVYGVAPFVLTTIGAGRNLWFGRLGLTSLIQACGISRDGGFPLAVLSTADLDSMGRKNLLVTPSTFAGEIVMSLDFYVAYSSRLPPDGEAMFFAIGDALINSFNTGASYGLMPSGLMYGNESRYQQDNLEFDGTRWIQCIPCAFLFRRVA